MSRALFDPSKFTTTKGKVLPVVLLLDVSGSMDEVVSGTFTRTGQMVERDGKTWEMVDGGVTRIQLLNEAVSKVLATLAKQEGMGFEFLLSVFTFGETVSLHLAPTAAATAAWTAMQADGETPLGAALGLVKEMIEDRARTPSRAYRPTVVLVSDGRPTDEWEAPLADFVTNGRSSKCDRMAMAIGKEADEAMLQKFIAGTEHKLFRAEDAATIHEFFKLVTMSVTMRSRSQDPDVVPSEKDIRLDGPSLVQQTSATKSGSKEPTSGSDEGYW